MASALLASRNESYWGERKVYMRKTPNPKFIRNEPAEPPPSVSDNDTVTTRKPGHVTYNIGSYNRRELKELKRRLGSELDQVRSVISRIEGSQIQSSARSVGYSTSGIYCGGPREVTSTSKPTSTVRSIATEAELKKHISTTMKRCGSILMKLMKLKGSAWFNSPVDVVGMGLHDYHQIIKQPMDLGTVKSKMNRNLYPSPKEFASDVVLTFTNALTYNPEGHEVHKLARQLLTHFESVFSPVYDKFELRKAAIVREVVPEVKSDPPPIIAQTPVPVPIIPQPATQPPPQQVITRRAKPKAKEPNKRAMSIEEKQKLGSALQSLPQEKMGQVLQIVKKRNIETEQDGDEIELDFEVMDTETLWELDRFVCNCKKMVSKMRRQEAIPPAPPHSPPPPILNRSPETTPAKKSVPADEDVDIGDEMPAVHYPSVEIVKDAGSSSSSSSSSSGSSSSSDSDTGSSSGSDSDDDGGGGARSPGVGPRN